MAAWSRQEWLRFATSLSLGLVLLGFVLANQYIDLSNQGFFQSWEPLGAPLARANKIISASYNSIIVQAEDGRIYSRCTKYCPYDPGHPDANWVPAATSMEPKDPSQSPLFDQPLAKQPPSKAIDVIKFRLAWPEGIADIQYAITEDGSVWRWESGGGIGTAFSGLCIGPILGLLVGSIIALVLYNFYNGQNQILFDNSQT